ncbi:excalibur calcium-binding domain-containing protein, partial [Gemmatimonas sp.]|uniref:excalibur calcium-binding domain-containing protein n=1 Tax=Gemmatimonas sp. TaxID=1962908 RepID=UPI0035626B0B
MNLDFAGQTIPNGAFAPLGDGGKVSIYTTFPTDILIDVFGYFVPAASATAGRFVPLTPTRILDTRVNLGWTAPTPPPTTPTPPPTTPTTPANPGDTKNCSDFSTQAAAQLWFNLYFPSYGDVARLDADGDGVACESLPLTAALRSAALVSARTTIPLQVSGVGGVPTSGVSAVVMNVTAAGPTSDGFVQVSPTGIAVGDTSNLNPEKNRT